MFGNRQGYKLALIVLGLLGLMSVLGEIMFWAVRFWLVLVPLMVVFAILIWHGLQPEHPDGPPPSLLDRFESAVTKFVLTVVLFGAAFTALTFGGYILVLRTGFWLVSAPVLIAIIALILYTLRPHRT